MQEAFGGYIKIVADVASGKLAGGGQLHQDCEQILLEQGSRQSDLWGGGVDLPGKTVGFNALINIRPAEGNPSQEILDPKIREEFESVVKRFILPAL